MNSSAHAGEGLGAVDPCMPFVDLPPMPSFTVMQLVHLIATAHDTFFNRMLEKTGLTRSQMEILILLNQNPERRVNQRTLEQELSLSNPTVAGLLKRLEAKGCIRRVPDPDDARAKCVLLTQQVQRALPLAKKMVQEFDVQLSAQFTQAELRDLERSLRGFYNQLCACGDSMPEPDIFFGGTCDNE